MNDDLAVATSNGSIEVFEAALEEAGDVVERHLFRKVFLTILVLVVAAVIVKKIVDTTGGTGSAAEPATPEPASADEPESDE